MGEIWQCICVFCDFMFTKQMALSFNINNKRGMGQKVYNYKKGCKRVGVHDILIARPNSAS